MLNFFCLQQKSKNKLEAETRDETLNELPPEFRTMTGRLRKPVNYNLADSSEEEF